MKEMNPELVESLAYLEEKQQRSRSLVVWDTPTPIIDFGSFEWEVPFLTVWLDDVRPMPKDFDVHVKNAHDAIEILKKNRVRLISLDHDLGEDAQTGYDVAKFIEKQAYEYSIDNKNGLKPIEIRVHSSNPAGVKNILMCIENAYDFWDTEA